MKKILVVIFLVFALVSWGCDDGKKTLSGDEEGIILIEERTLTEEEIEEECPNGGVKIVTGFDKNGNGVLDEDEIYDTHFVCHGEDGKDGEDGADGEDGDKGDKGDKGDQGYPGDQGEKGEDGTSTLTKVVPIEEGDTGHDCENGGYWVITCEDNGDAECVEDTEKYEAVCHGVDGDQGDPGDQGDQGDPGNDGACYGNTAPVIDEIMINGIEYTETPVAILDGIAAVNIVATDEDDGDELAYVITGSGAMIVQDETDKHKFTLTFNSEGIYYFSVIVSDGCQMAVKSFAVDVVCAGDFPHFHKGLCWSDRLTSTNWANAISYCEDMGGRLPNIQELRMLIQNCPQTEYPQPDGQDPWCEIEDPDKLASGDWTDACNPECSGDLNVFGNTGYFRSSSSHVDNTDNAWGVSFGYGNVSNRNKATLYYAMCVR